jgi:tetratricopeptide (TPR) repeat protein
VTARAALALAAALLTLAPRTSSPAAPPAGIAIEPAGESLARLDSLQAIVREEEERVRHSPGLESGWTRLARAWFQVGDQAKAAKCLERARNVGGREFDTVLLSGRIARTEGRMAEAIDGLERAARMRPEDWEAHEDLGLAYYQAGRDADAADQWERARTLPGSGSPDRSGWIEALRKAGDGAYQVSGRGRERLRFVAQPLHGPLVVPVRINGRGPFLLRVDAGSPEVVLHQSLARELGLGIFPGARSEGAAGTAGVTLDYAAADSLALGATTVRRLPVAISTDARLARPGEPRGLLGFEVLRRFRFCIDLRDSTLWLDPALPIGAPADSVRPEWAPAGAHVHRLPVLLRGTHLLIAYGRLNQGPERPFLLDATGTGTAFSAPISTLAESGVTLDSARVVTGVTGAGSLHVILFPITRLCVADACQDSLTGTYGAFAPRLEQNPSFRLAGIVSGAFLTRFRIGVDADRREIWLVEP